MIRYARAPSPALRALVAPGGLLRPLVTRRSVAGLPLDVHFRERDHVHVYCGLTRVLDVNLGRSGVRIDADARYAEQPCARDLFRRWGCDEAGFEAALERYLGGVVVGRQWVDGEGAVQAAWAALRAPWVPLDREAVLGYEDRGAQSAGRAFAGVAAARDAIERARAKHGWAALPEGKVGAELDQLAIDGEGRLVLIELKDAGASAPSVFYAPLQLLQYVYEWAAAYDSVRSSLEARLAVGLSPPSLPPLTAGLRPVVGFGEDLRSREVRARFATVLEIVNAFLPGGVTPIEAWALTEGRPHA